VPVMVQPFFYKKQEKICTIVKIMLPLQRNINIYTNEKKFFILFIRNSFCFVELG
jgi:hypothetical protein